MNDMFSKKDYLERLGALAILKEYYIKRGLGAEFDELMLSLKIIEALEAVFANLPAQEEIDMFDWYASKDTYKGAKLISELLLYLETVRKPALLVALRAAFPTPNPQDPVFLELKNRCGEFVELASVLNTLVAEQSPGTETGQD